MAQMTRGSQVNIAKKIARRFSPIPPLRGAKPNLRCQRNGQSSLFSKWEISRSKWLFIVMVFPRYWSLRMVSQLQCHYGKLHFMQYRNFSADEDMDTFN
jgi:hypothetical protein